MNWNEWALVVFLFLLITAAQWLPSFGERLGAFIAQRKGISPPAASGPAPSSPPEGPTSTPSSSA